MGKAKQQKNARLLFKSVSAPDEKTVRAVVAASTLDRDGDVIDVASMRLPLKGGGHIYARELTGAEPIDLPLFVNHERDVRSVIGSARSAVLNDAGELEMTFGFSSRELAQDMHTLIREGHLDNAWSHTIIYDPYQDISDGVIYDAEVVEVSLVFRGSNYDARLLEVSKSLRKGLEVSKKEEKRAEMEKHLQAAEALKKELDEGGEQPEVTDTPETPEAETPVETPAAPEPTNPENTETDTPETPEAPEEGEQPTPADNPENPEKEELKPKDESPEATPKKEEDKVNPQKAVAQKQAAAGAPSDIGENDSPRVDATQLSKETSRELKVITVKQLYAYLNRDMGSLRELNEKAMQLDAANAKTKALKKKEITYANGAPLYLAEQLDRDIDRQMADVGNVGRLVTRKRLNESPKYRKIVRTDGVQFQPVGFSGKKQQDKPTWTSFTLEPKPFAVIVAWSDHVNEDAMVNTYDEIVQDIAEAQAALEDKLILTFEQVTANGTVFPTQGLLPLLEAAGGRTVGYDYTADSFLTAFASAWGKIHSAARKNLSLVMNGAEWGQVALLRDTQGRPLFLADEQGRISMGGLGRFTVATSDELSVGEMVLGNYKNYILADKMGLQLKGSSDATVGSLNLFEEDASALRAVLREEGGTPRLNAFVKLERSESQ